MQNNRAVKQTLDVFRVRSQFWADIVVASDVAMVRKKYNHEVVVKEFGAIVEGNFAADTFARAVERLAMLCQAAGARED